MKIKENRKKLNMTQADLAQELNIAKSTISKGENGTMEPSISDIKKLTKLFGTTIEDLIKPPDPSNKTSGKVTSVSKGNKEIAIETLTMKGHGETEEWKESVKKPRFLIHTKGDKYLSMQPLMHLLLFAALLVPCFFIGKFIFEGADWNGSLDEAGFEARQNTASYGFGFLGYIYLISGVISFGIKSIILGESYEDGLVEFLCLPFKSPMYLIILPFASIGMTFTSYNSEKEMSEYHEHKMNVYKSRVDINNYMGALIRSIKGKEIINVFGEKNVKSYQTSTPHTTTTTHKVSDSSTGSGTRDVKSNSTTHVNQTHYYEDSSNIEIVLLTGEKLFLKSKDKRDYEILHNLGSKYK